MRYMRERQNRYSIRKLTVGAASVLIGFAFVSSAQTAKAAEVQPAKEQVVIQGKKTDKPHDADLPNIDKNVKSEKMGGQ